MLGRLGRLIRSSLWPIRSKVLANRLSIFRFDTISVCETSGCFRSTPNVSGPRSALHYFIGFRHALLILGLTLSTSMVINAQAAFPAAQAGQGGTPARLIYQYPVASYHLDPTDPTRQVFEIDFLTSYYSLFSLFAKTDMRQISTPLYMEPLFVSLSTSGASQESVGGSVGTRFPIPPVGIVELLPFLGIGPFVVGVHWLEVSEQVTGLTRWDVSLPIHIGGFSSGLPAAGWIKLVPRVTFDIGDLIDNNDPFGFLIGLQLRPAFGASEARDLESIAGATQ